MQRTNTPTISRLWLSPDCFRRFAEKRTKRLQKTPREDANNNEEGQSRYQGLLSFTADPKKEAKERMMSRFFTDWLMIGGKGFYVHLYTCLYVGVPGSLLYSSAVGVSRLLASRILYRFLVFVFLVTLT
jgi:hypothetical protein